MIKKINNKILLVVVDNEILREFTSEKELKKNKINQ